jgi:hypothetical protein
MNLWLTSLTFVTNAMDFIRPPSTWHPWPVERRQKMPRPLSSTMNSIHQHGSNRLAGLVKSGVDSRSIYKGYGETDRYGCRIGLRLSRIKRLPESIKQLIYKYRKLHRQGLDGKFGSINDTKKTTRQHKFHRVLEIYWEIENDMDGLALRARTAGWTVNVTEDDHEEGLDEHDIGRAEEVMKRPMKLGRQRPHRSWYLSRKENLEPIRGLLP